MDERWHDAPQNPTSEPTTLLIGEHTMNDLSDLTNEQLGDALKYHAVNLEAIKRYLEEASKRLAPSELPEPSRSGHYS